MSDFIVSARKYRPSTFESVVGQRHITSTLENAITRNQLAHAYLFCGPRGVGKTTCARIFAKTINCLDPREGRACGACESCLGFDQERSFNIHELDAASNNSVDDIRTLTVQVRVPPQIGKYSVYIIDEAHMLSKAAFNAFLKTLEEPPAHAIFILATTEKHKIIPTILSRCQIFDFNRIKVEDAVGYLRYIAGEEGVTSDDESLHLIAQKANGAMRDALSMFDKAVSFCGNELNFKEVATTLNVLDYDTYFNITSLILDGNYPEVLVLFDDILSKGFSEQVFITGINRHFRDLLMCKTEQTLKLLEVSGTLLNRYKKESEGCSVGFLFEAIALLTTLESSLRTASNQRLNVELGLMKLSGLGQKKNGSGSVDNIGGDGTEKKAEATQTEGEGEGEGSKAGQFESEPNGNKNISAELAVSIDNIGGVELPELIPAKEEKKQSAKQQKKEAQEIESERRVEGEAEGERSEERENERKKKGDGEDGGESINTSTDIKRSIAAKEHKTISGESIASLLSSPRGRYEKEGSNGVEIQTGIEAQQSREIDSESEQKINQHRDKFIRNLNSERPRIVQAFQNMRVEGHTIYLDLPSESLREEILRNRVEILTMLSEIAGVQGVLDMNIEVVEQERFLKPVKVEDKLRFLLEKNQALSRMMQKLSLTPE